MLGRNNRRAPRGNATLATPGRILKQLDDVKRAWWDAWQKEAIGQFVPGNSKWKPNKILPQVGDICVYLNQKRLDGPNQWARVCLYRSRSLRELNCERKCKKLLVI